MYREKENEFETKDDFYQNFERQERINFSEQSQSILLQESESHLKSSIESSISQLSEMDADESLKLSSKQMSRLSLQKESRKNDEDKCESISSSDNDSNLHMKIEIKMPYNQLHKNNTPSKPQKRRRRRDVVFK